ncbi:MAG: 50S ribosomal protein L11 methyltransferase [Rhodobiaceae bacterium]|nr:50S ribosomal protein L11 methyltransferase [Rhodobiaceae bacterium]
MYLLQLAARDAADADRIVDMLLALPWPDTSAAAALEIGNTWRVDAYYAEEPEPEALALIGELTTATDLDRRISLTALADRNWVKESLEAMPPVHAGRFTIHGRHDRDRVPANAIGIEIEANLAFGTGHHGTTRGCLLLLDEVLKRDRPYHVLDIGTGTGVLAIAAARALHVPVTASDIDPVSVKIAAENAHANRAGAWVRPVLAAGFAHRDLRAGVPYDLVLANILAGPLMGLAPDMARAIRSGGYAILSGILTWQAPKVLAAMRNQGLVLGRRIVLDGWTSLLLERR